MRIKLKVLISAWLMCSFLLVYPQQVQPDEIKSVTIDGKKFYLHTVKKGEGLYRISKNYRVSQEEILNSNPDISDALNVGQLVKIPVIEGRNSDIRLLSDEPHYIYHTILKGQTAYFLSKKYGVPIEVVYDFNPGTKNSLQEGTVIKIPVSKISVSNPDAFDSTQKYIYHTVAPQETIYGIARRYQISAQKLVEENPGIASGTVKTGSVLRIPSSDAESATTTELQDISKGNRANLQNESNSLLNSDKFIHHKVSKKETLFGISKKYNIDIDIIKKVNPEVDFTRLQKGLMLKIPTPEWIENLYVTKAKEVPDLPKENAFVVQTSGCGSYHYDPERPTIKIGILLPFNLSSGSVPADDEMTAKEPSLTGESESRHVSGRTRTVLEFYEGILYSIDSFKEKGVNIKLYVYDTGSENANIYQVLERSELSQTDLIIGPAFSEQIKAVSDFSVKHRIQMINPFTVSNNQLTSNSRLFQMTPADTLLMTRIAETIAERAKSKNLILIHSDTPKHAFEKNIGQEIKRQLFLSSSVYPDKPDMTEYTYSRGAISQIDAMLSRTNENIIFVPSSDEIFVNQVINSLNALAEKGTHKMTLVGMPEWLKFQTINAEYIHRLNGHIFSYYGVDYQLESTKQFIDGYRQYFSSEPFAFHPFFHKPSANVSYSRYGIWGYDIATYFIGALVKYGKGFDQCLDDYSPGLIQSNFHFSRISNWGGFYNDGLFLLNFKNDFTIERQVLKYEPR